MGFPQNYSLLMHLQDVHHSQQQLGLLLRIDYGDGRVIKGSSIKMVISQLWNVIFRHAIHH